MARVLQLGGTVTWRYADNLVLGRIQLIHFKNGLRANEREVAWQALDPLGRLSGKRYCAVRTVIESD